MVMPISPDYSAQTNGTRDLKPSQQADQVLRQLVPSIGVTATTLDPDTLMEPMLRINDTLRSYSLHFEMHSDHDRLITRIVDAETGDLIRQIPAEEVLRISEHLDLIQGLLIQQEA